MTPEQRAAMEQMQAAQMAMVQATAASAAAPAAATPAASPSGRSPGRPQRAVGLRLKPRLSATQKGS